MQIYFSEIKKHILGEIKAAEEEILIAVSWLTDRELFSLLLDKLTGGVKVSIITRNDYLNNHNNALPWKKFVESGGELRFCAAGDMLHYKFAIIDGYRVMATSYNWTCFAGSNNRENIMLIQEHDAIDSFKKEFGYLSKKFEIVKNPQRFDFDTINEKLHGFYQITIQDDEKNQAFGTNW